MRTKLINSSRSSSSKQLKTFSLTGLNSYKIDTSSLQQKAKQIQLLKTSLLTQISQYKASQISYQQQCSRLTQQNKQLKGKIKKLQTQLNKIKSQKTQKQKITSQQQKNSGSLNGKILGLQGKIEKLEGKIQKKDQYITELEQYKKMYEIEVQNKNNIMNFYETKLDGFKKDKMTLISKYQEKISILESGLEMNTTYVPIQQNTTAMNRTRQLNSKTNISLNKSSSSTFKQAKLPQSNKRFSIQSSNNNQKKLQRIKTPSSSQSNQPAMNNSRSIKFIKKSVNNTTFANNSNTNQTNKPQNSQPSQTPYKLLKINSQNQLKYQTPNLNGKQVSTKDNIKIDFYDRRQVNEISISSSASYRNRQNLLGNSRNGAAMSSNYNLNNNKMSNKNLLSTNKTLKKDTQFLNLIKQVFKNLQNKNLRSENLKNFNSIRNFIQLLNPTQQEIILLFHSFPFAPVDLEDTQFQYVIEYIRKYLLKKYGNWTGNLVIDTIIDKLEDFEIAYEVNSQDQGEIIAGLSSNQQQD